MFKLYDVVDFRGDKAGIIQVVKDGVYVIQLTSGDKALVNKGEITKIEDNRS